MIVGPEFLQSTASICRALSRPATHLVLLGMAGSGKMESLHIACNILNIKLVSVIPIRNYGIEDFYGDIKIVSVKRKFLANVRSENVFVNRILGIC